MEMMRRCFLVLIAVAVIISLGGCKKDEAPAEKELVLLCGSSFVNPAKQLCDEFTAKTGIKIVTSSEGSEVFLPQIKLAQQGDIFITHDPFLDLVDEAKFLGDHVHVGFVAPVLAVQKGNPKGIKSIEDMTKEGIRVALTDPKYSTCGEMVFALIEKKGIKDAMLKNVDTRLTTGHSALGTFLQTEAVDAVIMWNGVSKSFADSLEVVKVPYEYDTEIKVHVMGLNYTKQPDELKQFMDFAKERGPAIFEEYGYVK